ncbi:hypothetical protein T06_8436 [Trichinella sp. T6]|nr:hypothetical protein T06_8436 [Trichinella sp. T6]
MATSSFRQLRQHEAWATHTVHPVSTSTRRRMPPTFIRTAGSASVSGRGNRRLALMPLSRAPALTTPRRRPRQLRVGGFCLPGSPPCRRARQSLAKWFGLPHSKHRCPGGAVGLCTPGPRALKHVFGASTGRSSVIMARARVRIWLSPRYPIRDLTLSCWRTFSGRPATKAHARAFSETPPNNVASLLSSARKTSGDSSGPSFLETNWS